MRPRRRPRDITRHPLGNDRDRAKNSTDLGCASLQTSRHSESNQIAVDIRTAYRIVMITASLCQNTHRLCLTPTCPASPTVPESGRPNQRVSRKARRGPDRLVPPVGAASGRLFPPNVWPPLPFGPNRDHGGRDPPPRRSGAGHTQTWDSRRRRARQDRTGRAVWGGSRGPDPRERCVVVGCLQCPECCCCVAPSDPAGQTCPRRSHFGKPAADESTKGSARGLAQEELTRALEAAVGISGWQLAKRYCGEIGSQGLRDDLDTEIPRVVHRLPGVGRAETASPGEGRASKWSSSRRSHSRSKKASSTCGQAEQTRPRNCEVFPCVFCILQRFIPRGYSVARRARCSGKFSAGQQA